MEFFLPPGFSLPLKHAAELLAQRCVGTGITVLSQTAPESPAPAAGASGAQEQAPAPTPASHGDAEGLDPRTSFAGEASSPCVHSRSSPPAASAVRCICGEPFLPSLRSNCCNEVSLRFLVVAQLLASHPPSRRKLTSASAREAPPGAC